MELDVNHASSSAAKHETIEAGNFKNTQYSKMYLNPHWMTLFIYSGNTYWVLIKGETLTTLSRGRGLDSLGKSSGAR